MTSVKVGGFQSSESQSHLRDIIRDACQDQATKMFRIEVFLIAKKRREGVGKRKREARERNEGKEGMKETGRKGGGRGEGSKAQQQSSS